MRREKQEGTCERAKSTARGFFFRRGDLFPVTLDNHRPETSDARVSDRQQYTNLSTDAVGVVDNLVLLPARFQPKREPGCQQNPTNNAAQRTIGSLCTTKTFFPSHLTPHCPIPRVANFSLHAVIIAGNEVPCVASCHFSQHVKTYFSPAAHFAWLMRPS